MEPTCVFSILGEHLPAGTTVLGFRGTEAISRPYQIEVFLQIPEAARGNLELEALVDAEATLSIHDGQGTTRQVFRGIWSTVELLRARHQGDLILQARLVPRLYWLSQARRSRVFVGQTLPDIIRSVLKECGFADDNWELRLENPKRYLPLDHVCQYRETNLEFLSRRLEHDGLCYFFAHPIDGPHEKLVITDSRAFVEPLSGHPVRFLGRDDNEDGDGIPDVTEGLEAFTCQVHSVPMGVRTRGRDYLRPSVTIGGQAQTVDAPEEAFTLSFSEPVRDEAEARRLATVRSEEVRCRKAVYAGRGRIFEVRPGYSFEVDEHPLLMGEYLAIEVEHQGCTQGPQAKRMRRLGLGPQVYQVVLKAIPVEVQFRPERVTPRPRVYGMETGLIAGRHDSVYAQIDEYGRYLVKLLFDEHDEQAVPSTPIRMMQPHGGAQGAGFHFPLRKGSEVLVSFLRGDPDQPVITGVVPNAEHPSPVTEDNATKNVIQTGGGSRLEIQDSAEHQYVKWQTPYANTRFHIGGPHNPQNAVDIATEENAQLAADKNWKLIAGENKYEQIKGKVWEQYGWQGPAKPETTDLSEMTLTETHQTVVFGTKRTTVTGWGVEEYGLGMSGDPTDEPDEETKHEVIVHGNEEVTVHGTRTTVIDEKGDDTFKHDLKRLIKGDLEEEVNGDRSSTVNGEVIEHFHDGVTRRITGDLDETISGQNFTNFQADVHEYTCGTSFTVWGGAKLDIEMGSANSMSLAASLDLMVGAAISIAVGATMDISLAFTYEWSNTKFNNSATETDNIMTWIKTSTMVLDQAVFHIMP